MVIMGVTSLLIGTRAFFDPTFKEETSARAFHSLAVGAGLFMGLFSIAGWIVELVSMEKIFIQLNKLLDKKDQLGNGEMYARVIEAAKFELVMQEAKQPQNKPSRLKALKTMALGTRVIEKMGENREDLVREVHQAFIREEKKVTDEKVIEAKQRLGNLLAGFSYHVVREVMSMVDKVVQQVMTDRGKAKANATEEEAQNLLLYVKWVVINKFEKMLGNLVPVEQALVKQAFNKIARFNVEASRAKVKAIVQTAVAEYQCLHYRFMAESRNIETKLPVFLKAQSEYSVLAPFFLAGSMAAYGGFQGEWLVFVLMLTTAVFCLANKIFAGIYKQCFRGALNELKQLTSNLDLNMGRLSLEIKRETAVVEARQEEFASPSFS